MTGDHKEREHSKFSASGSERWLNCPASVALEEASPPSADSFWSKEGTLAHECLEAMLLRKPLPDSFDVTQEMIDYVTQVVQKIRAIHTATGGILLVEKRVWATYIHEEMFGTCDMIVAKVDDWLHIGDFKYGAGHVVNPEKNTQLIQYALSVAESYDWRFPKITMHIFQPRAGKNWHKRWTITMEELKDFWLPLWEKGVARCESRHAKPFPGSWCHWCRAKFTCPAKADKRAQEIRNVFETNPIESEANNGLKKAGKEKGHGQQAGAKATPQKGQGRQGQTKRVTFTQVETEDEADPDDWGGLFRGYDPDGSQ